MLCDIFVEPQDEDRMILKDETSQLFIFIFYNTYYLSFFRDKCIKIAKISKLILYLHIHQNNLEDTHIIYGKLRNCVVFSFIRISIHFSFVYNETIRKNRSK